MIRGGAGILTTESYILTVERERERERERRLFSGLVAGSVKSNVCFGRFGRVEMLPLGEG